MRKALPVALFCCLFFILALTSAVQKSSTFDETHYLGIGKYLLLKGTWDIQGAILHPPLSFYLTGLPSLFFPTDESVWEYPAGTKRDLVFLGSADYRRGQMLLLSGGDALLNFSRLMQIALGASLGLFIFAWTRRLYSYRCAIAALFFFSLSPNLLAHARLITPDMTLTTMFFAALYFWWVTVKTDSRGHALAGGVFFGLALLSKYTALLLFPILAATLAAYAIRNRKALWRSPLLYTITGVAVVFLGYRLNIEPYWKGVLFQLQHASSGHGSFLLGQYSTEGWWYFFPLTFLLKTPVPTLFLLAGALCWLVHDGIRRPRDERVLDQCFLLVPVVCLFLLHIVKHQSIGLRYILPVYPFIFVFISRVADLRSKYIGWLLALLGCAYAASCLSVYPHYLAYFNEPSGGPKRGYERLVDSNLDWGQDLKGLKKYLDKKGIRGEIYLSYFGSDIPERYGIRCIWMPSIITRNRDRVQTTEPKQGIVAISATNFQGVYFRDKRAFKWLLKHKLVDQIGYSILIFELDPGT